MHFLKQLLFALGLMLYACSSALGQPSVEESAGSTNEQKLLSLVANADPVQLNAFRLLEQDKDSEVRSVLLTALSAEQQDSLRRRQLLYFLAFLEQKQDNFMKAVKYLKEIQALIEKADPPNLLDQATCERRIGDCYYSERKINDAIDSYRSALITIGYLKGNKQLKIELLEALNGCATIQGKPVESKRYLEEVTKLLATAAINGSIADLVSYFWSDLELVRVYRQLDEQEKAANASTIARGLLKKFMKLREELEAQDRLKDIQERATLDYLRASRPSSIADCLWLASGLKLKSLPLITWTDNTVPAKAAIVCIHGMGLENRAYTLLGQTLSKRGFIVSALDVRGFGSWLAAPGNETIGFKDTINDIKYVIEFLKQEHNGIPVFILGESMGGAIALRAAAELGDIANGVISSVPSAEQFQRRKMALDVAFHFLKNPNKPYEVLGGIAEQATSRDSLRTIWTEDMKAKSHVSPKEMIKFAIFMRRTERACHKIKNTPVFIVQGLGDELVKPKGTFKMYQNVASKDKTIMVIGKAEHLIFETDAQNYMLLNTITDWMKERLDEVVNEPSLSGKS